MGIFESEESAAIDIRVSPDSKAADALCICYAKKRVYRHCDRAFFVTSLDVQGVGDSTRLIAHLEPVWKDLGALF